MDVREKLAELIESARYWGSNTSEEIADHLISHGITVPEWISVKDRLPDKDGYYLCCFKSSLFPDGVYIDILECDKGSYEDGYIYADTVTHWMPLPEPPKGE